MVEKQWMTYSQIAERLGVTPDAIRHRSRKEGWQRQEGNDGKIRVLIDPELLSEIPTRNRTASDPYSARNSGHDSDRSDREIWRLEDHLQTLRQQVDQQRADYREELERLRAVHAADLERVEARLIEERAQLQDRLQEALAEADYAKSDQIRMARDMTMMFDELKALADKHAALHADQARLQAELDQARAELAMTRRPWWRWFSK
jgi:predicted transcriptional regulator